MILLLVLALTAFGLIAGMMIGYLASVRADDARLKSLTERLIAEQRMDTTTRVTLQAMRDAARGRG